MTPEQLKALRMAEDMLTAVLCDPEGKCCISGSMADLRIVDSALAILRHLATQPQAQPEPVDFDDGDTGRLPPPAPDAQPELVGDERRHFVCICPDCTARKPEPVALTKAQIAEAMLAVDDPLKWGLLQGDSKMVEDFARAVLKAQKEKQP